MIEFTSVTDTIGAVLLLLGASLSMVGGLGLWLFPDVLTRLHAATKPQVLGLLLALIGVGMVLKTWAIVPLLAVAWGLQLLTAPVSAHLVGRATYRSKHLAEERLFVDELADVVQAHDDED